jgi:Aspartyl protease
MARHTGFYLSCALLFSCSAVNAQRGSVAQVVPLRLYGQHLVVVQGSIGPLEKRNLVIDTGAYPSIIDRDVAKKLHLSGHNQALDAVDHSLIRTAVVVPALEVGPIHVTGLRSLVDDLSAVSQKFGVRIDALIGLDVLNHSSFRVDYATRKMFFGPVDPLPSSAPFQLEDSMICVDLKMGRQSVRLLLDTGAERLLLLGSRVSGLRGHPGRAQEFTNLGGNFRLREISLDSLQLGDTNLSAQPIFVSDATNMPAHRFDGFLSTAQFQQIAFDFERQEFSWMTKDSRLKEVRVAADSSTPPAYVAAFAEGISGARSTTPQGNRCGDQQAGNVSCGTR